MFRRIMAGVAALVSVLVVLPALSAAAGAPDSTAVYRFWSNDFRGHFYTTSVSERDSIIANYPDSTWSYEGAAYGAFDTQVAGTVPLYRFWSARYRGHFFTTDAGERDTVIATYDDETWHFEGIAFYVYPSTTANAGTRTVARFWSDGFRHHFYTADATEAAYVKANYPSNVWRFEADAFKVPVAAPVVAPPPASYLADTVWSGVDSDGDEWEFTFQSDGTVMLGFRSAASLDWYFWDDPLDTWTLTGSTLRIHIEDGDADTNFEGPVAVGSLGLNGTWSGGMFTVTIAKK